MKEAENARFERFTRCLCSVAYKTADLVAVGVHSPKDFPKTSEKAFPAVFGKAGGRGIPVAEWQRGKEAMEEYAKYSRKGGKP